MFRVAAGRIGCALAQSKHSYEPSWISDARRCVGERTGSQIRTVPLAALPVPKVPNGASTAPGRRLCGPPSSSFVLSGPGSAAPTSWTPILDLARRVVGLVLHGAAERRDRLARLPQLPVHLAEPGALLRIPGTQQEAVLQHVFDPFKMGIVHGLVASRRSARRIPAATGPPGSRAYREPRVNCPFPADPPARRDKLDTHGPAKVPRSAAKIPAIQHSRAWGRARPPPGPRPLLTASPYPPSLRPTRLRRRPRPRRCRPRRSPRRLSRRG